MLTIIVAFFENIFMMIIFNGYSWVVFCVVLLVYFVVVQYVMNCYLFSSLLFIDALL